MRYRNMKKVVIIFVLFVTFKAYSQDVEPVKKLWLGVGPAWGTLGWGGNLNLSYDANKKFSIKLKGVLGANKEKSYEYQYDGIIHGSFNYDISASANYYLLGKTNGNQALYIGVGAGYFSQTTNTTDLYIGYYYPSDKEKTIARGLALNGSLGVESKLGPGKIYAEGYFSITVMGEFVDTMTHYDGIPGSFKTYISHDKMSVQNGYQAIICINAGYKIPF